MEQNSIIKIAVVGPESTGKTWLCEALAKHYQTVWVPEYAREYFNQSDIYNYTLSDLELIARKQIESENELLIKANRFLFCDTTLITLKIWADLEFNTTLASIEEELVKRHYDLYLITNTDIPWHKDEQRQNKFNRNRIFEMNLELLAKSQIPHAIISGKEELRLYSAIEQIDNKWNKQVD